MLATSSEQLRYYNMYKNVYIKQNILRLQKTVTDLKQANHSDLTITKLRTYNIIGYYTRHIQRLCKVMSSQFY